MSKRKIASNIILLLFFIVVASAAFFSDLFQNHVKTGKQMIEQSKLFSDSDLSRIEKITLKNKTGEFVFERSGSTQNSPWHMSAPRDLSANSVFIEKLFESLTVIKVKKIFPDEKINTSNFSIDKPTATLTLLDPNGIPTVIHFGLMNSIDNSTYLKIVSRPGIYHVDAPSVPLENATLLNLIESQIINLNVDTIESLKIFKSNKKNVQPLVDFTKKGISWFDADGSALSSDKIDEFFQDLSVLKSSFILDKQTEAQKKQIALLDKNPEYTLVIKDNKENSVEYSISGLTKAISELDLKNEEFFVVTTTSGATAYVVKKESLELFNKKAENFKSIAPAKVTPQESKR
jgi:hypothetical protein